MCKQAGSHIKQLAHSGIVSNLENEFALRVPILDGVPCLASMASASRCDVCEREFCAPQDWRARFSVPLLETLPRRQHKPSVLARMSPRTVSGSTACAPVGALEANRPVRSCFGPQTPICARRFVPPTRIGGRIAVALLCS
jgi:hypothetical protein